MENNLSLIAKPFVIATLLKLNKKNRTRILDPDNIISSE